MAINFSKRASDLIYSTIGHSLIHCLSRSPVYKSIHTSAAVFIPFTKGNVAIHICLRVVTVTF